MRICHETKGEGIKKVWQCLQGVQGKYVFDQMCNDKKECEKKEYVNYLTGYTA